MTEVPHKATLSYGPHPSQVVDYWRPRGASGSLPVVVLLHGGFWRFRYTKRLMNPLAAAIAARGAAVWNVEYRRVVRPGDGWPATFEDVSAAVAFLARLDGLNLNRVVTCGHSAGGHLALWLAANRGLDGTPAARVKVAGAVSLAGVPDLAAAGRLRLGRGAVDRLLGGTPDVVPDRYRAGSPAEMLPLGVPQVLVHGLQDADVPARLSERYVDQARACGDRADYVPLEGVGHLELIDPGSHAWAATWTRLEPMLG
jgi:acetyl esterase/lipase